MAVVNGNLGFKMWGVETGYGAVTYASGSTIIIEFGAQQTAVYTGSFTYDAYGNVYGNLRAPL